jgi:hypothetical protein
VPDDVVVVDAIPLGATGKIQKNLLRDRFRDHALPTRSSRAPDGAHRLNIASCGRPHRGGAVASIRSTAAHGNTICG